MKKPYKIAFTLLKHPLSLIYPLHSSGYITKSLQKEMSFTKEDLYTSKIFT
jgi:hypothetical protein